MTGEQETAETADADRENRRNSNAPALGTTTATGRAIAIPAKITVRKEDRRILGNRLRIQISRSANALDAIRAIFQAADLLAQIADMRVDPAIVAFVSSLPERR